MQENRQPHPRFQVNDSVGIELHRYFVMINPQFKQLENKSLTIQSYKFKNNLFYYTCKEYPNLEIPEPLLHDSVRRY